MIDGTRKHLNADQSSRKMTATCKFYVVKLPFILALICLGFLLEFLIELPFMVMCELDQRFGKRG